MLAFASLRRIPLLLILLATLIASAHSASAQTRDVKAIGAPTSLAGLPAPVLLWPDGAPGAKGTSDEDKPAIIPFLPTPDTNTGTAIIVAPGGAFTHRAMDYEGVTVAKWLQRHGIAAFVLRYRIMPLYTRNDAIADGLRAIQLLRARADAYKISPRRVGMIGFSAGSELTPLAVLQARDGHAGAPDAVERQSSRLDFMILAYGAAVAPGAESTRTATPAYPPTFMFCTAEDISHLNPMMSLYTELRRRNVPAEVHVFPVGEHGVGLAAGDRSLGTWPDLMLAWLRSSTFLTDTPRAAVKGHVLLDGAPLPHGSITFVPIERKTPRGAPTVTAYVMNTDTATADYTLDASHGPVAGQYRVEIRQDATVWVSNNRDPARNLPSAEREAFIRQPGWGAPTIDDIRLYTKRSPRGADLIVEIKDGENDLDVNVSTR